MGPVSNTPALPLAPSEDPEVLHRQLAAALDALATTKTPAPQLPRRAQAYLEQYMRFAWKSFAAGDLAAPGRLARRLGELMEHPHARVEVTLPPREEIARALLFTIEALSLAQPAADATQMQMYLRSVLEKKADRDDNARRAVLRVLALEADRSSVPEPLKSSDVHKRLPEPRVTHGRVTQILSELHRRGVLNRSEFPGQGASQVAHYSLADGVLEECRRKGLVPPATLKDIIVIPEHPRAEQFRNVAKGIAAQWSPGLRDTSGKPFLTEDEWSGESKVRRMVTTLPRQ